MTRRRTAADLARLAERGLLLRARHGAADGTDTWLADLQRKLAAASGWLAGPLAADASRRYAASTSSGISTWSMNPAPRGP